MKSELDELLIHTCSVVQASTATGDYGHGEPNWTTGTTTAGVACLLQPNTKHELLTGSVVATHNLYLKVADAPTTLRAHGASGTHRISSVALAGAVFDAGPFDITEIIDAGGQAHHLELRLKRVG